MSDIVRHKSTYVSFSTIISLLPQGTVFACVGLWKVQVQWSQSKDAFGLSWRVIGDRWWSGYSWIVGRHNCLDRNESTSTDSCPGSTSILHARLSPTRREWDPQLFMPGPICQSVSFPPDSDITDSEIYLFVAVLFFVIKNLRDGEPWVWKELNVARDAKFGLAPWGRPTWDDQRYGSLLLGEFYGDRGVKPLYNQW